MIELPLALIAILVPICVGLTSVAKIYVGDRFAPLSALVIGVGLTFGAVPGIALGLGFIVGAIVGLSAMGLYSGTKTTVQG